MIVEVRANDPVARELLQRAIKWIERLDKRRESIPHFFDNDTDPGPLAKNIRKYLLDSDPNPNSA